MNQSKAETIVFNGIPFRRYPNSKHNNHRNYYAPSGKYIKNGIKNLHVEIWKSVHGKVAENCHIHHKDGNPLNNAIENLECLSVEAHFEHHAKESKVRQAIAWKKTDKFREIQKLAAKWHGSDEGREWHREHAKQVFGNLEPRTYKCELCFAFFESKKRSGVRFCSNKCKAKWRRDSGVDDIEKTCDRCSKSFVSSKYDKIRFCSKICSARSTAFFSRQK